MFFCLFYFLLGASFSPWSVGVLFFNKTKSNSHHRICLEYTAIRNN